jgi:hypothetical protein
VERLLDLSVQWCVSGAVLWTVIAAELCDGVASCGGNRGDAAALSSQTTCRRSALAAVLATA